MKQMLSWPLRLFNPIQNLAYVSKAASIYNVFYTILYYRFYEIVAQRDYIPRLRALTIAEKNDF
jgi:hypothetical protein